MRRRPIPTVDESLRALEEAGVTDAPREAPDPEAHRALLDMALFVAEHRKKVTFPSFRWDDPRFEARDAKITLQLAYAKLGARVDETLREHAPRVADGRTILALDAHASSTREFELGHALYGKVTLSQWPTKPPEPTDLRIWDAVERGWSATLKEHNLIPGRGIVVLDEDQGLLLRDSGLRALVGMLIIFEDGQTKLWWNPFVAREHEESELQYWLKWGAGAGQPSGWRETFYVEKDDA